MADITWDDVTGLAAELSAVPLGAQTLILTHVNTALDPSFFTEAKLKLARVYLAAHMATEGATAAGGGAGPVTGRSQGDMSISYAAPSSSSTSEFSSTGYGRQYLSLIRSSPARAGLVL